MENNADNPQNETNTTPGESPADEGSLKEAESSLPVPPAEENLPPSSIPSLNNESASSAPAASKSIPSLAAVPAPAPSDPQEATSQPVSQKAQATASPASEAAPVEPNFQASSKMPLVLAALCGVAILIGMTALFVGFSGKSRSGENWELVSQHQEQAIGFENKFSEMNAQIDALSQENNRLETQMRTMAQQIQVALEKIGEEMSVTRSQISTLDGALTAAVKAMNNQQVITQTQASKKTSRANKQADEMAAQFSLSTEYRIEQGDTLAALSHRFNVPLPKLLTANPEIDPKRLQVGQKISIPTSQQG